MNKHILLLLLIFILSLSAPVLAAEPGNGKIEGRIVNGTTGSSDVTDQDVTLKTYINDAESGSATTKTDAGGRFVFAGLVTDTGYSYEAKLTYQEADYTSKRLSFGKGETSKPLELTVYDSTMSDEAVKVATAHTIIYVGQGSLEVIEIFSFSNESDKTYIGSGEITDKGTRRTLKLPLPNKATELQYGGELMVCCVLLDERGFFDTMPVLPGSKDIAYSYQVSYSGGEYTYSRMVNYPMSGFNLLVQGESVEVTSDQLVPEGLVEIEGNQFNNLSGGSFVPGDVLVAQLSGLPQASSQWTVIWIVLVLLILGGASVYLLRKRKLQPVRAESRPAQRRERLLAELAKLDDDFESGKVSEEFYHRRRTEKKAQLVELMQRSKGESGNR